MKKLLYLFIGFFIVIAISCSKEEVMTMEQEQQVLNQKLAEIVSIANSSNCTDASLWEISPIGAKACGGPTGYIAYSNTINEVEFLNLVANYTEEQNQFNLKWGVLSDCSVPTMPIGVTCIDNQPVFIYQ